MMTNEDLYQTPRPIQHELFLEQSFETHAPQLMRTKHNPEEQDEMDHRLSTAPPLPDLESASMRPAFRCSLQPRSLGQEDLQRRRCASWKHIDVPSSSDVLLPSLDDLASNSGSQGKFSLQRKPFRQLQNRSLSPQTVAHFY